MKKFGFLFAIMLVSLVLSACYMPTTNEEDDVLFETKHG